MRFNIEDYERAFPRKEKEVKKETKKEEFTMTDNEVDEVIDEPETKEVEPEKKEETVNG